jgi:hypothetical protein
MELDSLKTIWREQEDPAREDPDRIHLQDILRKKSRGTIFRIRRNLRHEGVFILAGYIPCILLYLFVFSGELWLLSLIFLAVLLLYGLYYNRKDRLLRKMECVACEVRSNLAGQVKVLGKYLRLYLWSGTLLTPVFFIASYVIVRQKNPAPHLIRNYFIHRDIPTPWWAEPVFVAILIIPFSIVLYFLNKWYVNKLYGRHLEKLKVLLREMDEE